ncbi:MAG TPA: glycosyltransferase family 2 protein [Candidatus Limnocylindria bacterium]|jgi:glycosyltransferase involved in cell wall biosynthesis|nr:glycosyltransferase family 2 protein [Candidatus Limnocylindria bacterium]
MPPLVSVLTPSLNQARWLPDNLQSVASQSYRQIEHVVMDGSSTDGSVDILRAIRRPRFIWRSERDEGQAQALNKAFAASSGEIIGWLNSDDAYFSPTVVAEVVDHFQQNPESDVVYGHGALVNADGVILHLMWSPRYRASLLPLLNFISQPTAFIRRRAIEARFVDESFQHVMDRELWLRLSARHRFSRLQRIVAIDRHQAARKGYVQRDVAARENRRLAAMYGIPAGISADAWRKTLKILIRLRGIGIVGLARPPHAFQAHHDGLAALVLRQAIVPRRLMATGD